MSRPFDKVLVANRGEIAVRIIRGLHEMGIASVAVYSDADATARHVRTADEAVRLGPAPARESYLSIEKIIAAAKATGAQAIHPGYGFLSENAAFAEAVTKAGLVFIGPSADAIRRLGDKANARGIAEEAGVPTTPGFTGSADVAVLLAAAERIGFPILLKPSGGGGGKGMKVVRSADEFEASLASSQREAAAAFGNAEIIVEKYVHPARHVEVQVFGDGRGNVVALGERECSLQRRHQKIVEECPSPVVDEVLRRRMCDAACRLSKAVNYASAGTVEFLLGPEGDFYFLEMNTRLQVEHPVTELVYGVDLVHAQVRVAAGEAIPEFLTNARPRGHAIEVRLYAEDPASGFLPTGGRILWLEEPAAPNVRVDSALEANGTVGTDYDPMLAKIAAWGVDREAARRKLVRALHDLVLLGVVTNADFLAALLEEEWFAKAEFHTGTIDVVRDAVVSKSTCGDTLDDAALLALAEIASRSASVVAARGNEPRANTDPFQTLGDFRLFDAEARS